LPVVVLTSVALSTAAVAGGCNSSTKHTSASVLLQKAKTTTDSATALHFKLTSKNVSLNSTNITGGEGDAVRPDGLVGSISVAISGFIANVKVAAKNGVFEAQLPFTSHYTKTNPANFGLQDPAQLFNPSTGLTKLLTLSSNPTLGPQERINGELLDTITYQIPGSTIPVLPDENPSQPVTMTVAINPSNYQLRLVTLVGPFTSATSNSTYTLVLSNYNEHVTITLPPTS
jgi:lipoprotein LprG